ncbi:uncharacterized protein LOC131605244 [Vicia villosa]|uniref:uncharacterized protein LOC131605244 n=1 Tax=Vicia villosa TaxID=3911 RepID=UPI00273CA3EC|nr:uncharacterized protein LOC131605244 [Vicia villosa]
MSLIAYVTEKEMFDALSSINDLTSPGIDGYGARFLKVAWPIIKEDIKAVVWDFFNNDRFYRASNNTLVTIIPKTAIANMVKNSRHISCCIVIYKIISKVMAKRLGKVLSKVVNVD